MSQPSSPQQTFIVDCHICRAKVAAIETGRSEEIGSDPESGIPYGERVQIGNCPRCSSILVGHSTQLDFEGYDGEYDRWSDSVRVFPKPSKIFASYRIPRLVTESLSEADRALQANANIAACVMFGRALEALCRDVIRGFDAKSVEVTIRRWRLMSIGSFRPSAPASVGHCG